MHHGANLSKGSHFLEVTTLKSPCHYFLLYLLQEISRARHLTLGQISALEEAWRENPDATIDDLQKPGEDEDPPTVALRWGCPPSVPQRKEAFAAACLLWACILSTSPAYVFLLVQLMESHLQV
jgi:hypothetical protein